MEPSRAAEPSLSRFLGRNRKTYRIPSTDEFSQTEKGHRYRYSLAKFAEIGVNIRDGNKWGTPWIYAARVKTSMKDKDDEKRAMVALKAYLKQWKDGWSINGFESIADYTLQCIGVDDFEPNQCSRDDPGHTTTFMLSYFVYPFKPGVGEMVAPTRRLPDNGKSTYFDGEAWLTDEIKQYGEKRRTCDDPGSLTDDSALTSVCYPHLALLQRTRS